MTDTGNAQKFLKAAQPVRPEQLKDFFHHKDCVSLNETVADYVAAEDRAGYQQCIAEVQALAEQGKLEYCALGTMSPQTPGDQFVIEILSGKTGPDSDVIDINLKTTDPNEPEAHYSVNREGLANIINTTPQGNQGYWLILIKQANEPPVVKTFKYTLSEKFIEWFCESDDADTAPTDAPAPAGN